MAEPVLSGASGPAVGVGLAWRCRPKPLLVLLAVIAVTMLLLRVRGRLWWCACGRPFLWSGDINSSHNSQHVFDPYSLTHMLHGVLFYGILAWGLPKLALSWRLTFAVAIEAGWELIENSPFVIERYRTATLALGYEGDAIANSLGDILSCALGFLLARRLGAWGSLALVLVTELVLLFWIKDNLFLSSLMLIHPVDSIKAWQMGM